MIFLFTQASVFLTTKTLIKKALEIVKVAKKLTLFKTTRDFYFLRK